MIWSLATLPAFSDTTLSLIHCVGHPALLAALDYVKLIPTTGPLHLLSAGRCCLPERGVVAEVSLSVPPSPLEIAATPSLSTNPEASFLSGAPVTHHVTSRHLSCRAVCSSRASTWSVLFATGSAEPGTCRPRRKRPANTYLMTVRMRHWTVAIILVCGHLLPVLFFIREPGVNMPHAARLGAGRQSLCHRSVLTCSARVTVFVDVASPSCALDAGGAVTAAAGRGRFGGRQAPRAWLCGV